MIYNQKIQKAIRFAVKTHEVYQKQKRKGKDIPYIVHPFTVGLILARAGAGEDVIIAGILHDTIEDSHKDHKVTKGMIAERFGAEVAELVDSVTEHHKELSWEERKQEALEHVKFFSHDSLLLKSADIIANATEILEDYRRDGDKTFERFNAPKDRILQNYDSVIGAILAKWPENPLHTDLCDIRSTFVSLDALGAEVGTSEIVFIPTMKSRLGE
jgi:(p)ppGpp synthase/HD superfamily hydrolase